MNNSQLIFTALRLTFVFLLGVFVEGIVTSIHSEVHAQPIIEISDDYPQSILSKIVYVPSKVDDDSTFYPDVEKWKSSESFTKKYPILSAGTHTCFFKIKNTSDTHLSLYLNAATLLVNEAILEEYVDSVRVRRERIGINYPFEQKEIQVGETVFKLNLPPNEERSYKVEITSIATFVLSMELQNESDLFGKEFLSNTFIFFALGVLIFALFINSIVYFYNRDNIFLFYVLYIFNYVLILLFVHGDIYRWNILSDLSYYFYIHKALIIVSNIVFSYFTIQFLQLKHYSTFSYRLLFTWIIYNIVILLPWNFISVETVLVPLLIPSLFIIISIITIAVYVYLKGYKPARFFILGRFTVILGVTANFLVSLDILPYNFWLVNAHVAGGILDALFIAFALADQVRMTNEERNRERKERLREQSLREEAQYRATTAELQAKAAEMQAKAIQEENARKGIELARARQIQESMLPSFPPLHESFDISVVLKTASEVGGDYYDFIEDENNNLLIAIGDASGHGLSAGVMVTMMKAALHFIPFTSLSSVLESLNEKLYVIRPKRLNMALSLLLVKGDQIDYATAAMPPVLILRRKENRLEEISCPALPIGSMKSLKIPVTNISSLQSGDVLVIASDGIIEHQNEKEELLGFDHFQSLIKHLPEGNADEIVDHIMDKLSEHFSLDTIADDMSLLVMVKK